jgi:hypothetical protein
MPGMGTALGLVELPFLLTTVVFGFLTARTISAPRCGASTASAACC